MSTPMQRALRHVAARAHGTPVDPPPPVTLHFHPDRGVLAALATDHRYRSQFETGTSNGGLTAHPGGDRWRWESRMFGGAYDGAPAADRPTYGALNRHHRAVGGAPRFGSAHLRLAAHVLDRATFCYPDSYWTPTDLGVLGTVGALVARAAADRADPLDDYVEAQVHGPLAIPGDVNALVLDPCYRGTAVARDAERLGCPVEWHGGFLLSVADLRAHPEYRGPEYVAVGEALAVDGHLDPAIRGAAARTGRHDQQALKRVWHYLARFGTPELTR